jgi:hypothetical protein
MFVLDDQILEKAAFLTPYFLCMLYHKELRMPLRLEIGDVLRGLGRL